jgi:ATP-binding protein involved in chromosome partitioning
MAFFTPEELPDSKYYIFGKEGGKLLAEKHGVPFLGEIPLIQGIRESGDNGQPMSIKEDMTRTYFAKLAENVAQQIAIRNAKLEKTKTVVVNQN